MPAPASSTVNQQEKAPLRYLPNGTAMKDCDAGDDDGKLYTLEKIVGTRRTNGLRYYLVKFNGYKMYVFD